jgi:uncharacterized protein with ParB-like and HNH nuclease domain
MFKDGNNFQQIGLFDLVKELEEEVIKLPLYQRDAIWTDGRNCALWDSLLRGFPLPSFLVTKGPGISRNLQTSSQPHRGESIQKEKENDYYDLLDGQQRVIAIDSVFKFDPKSSISRLWVDLAPKKEEHPFKFKFWIHACTKVFPFGFSLSTSGEHDFAPLTDHETTEIWRILQENVELKGKEFYQISLDKSLPHKASCPVPLDELIKMSINPLEKLEKSIMDLGNKGVEKKNKLIKNPQKPDPGVVKQVANAINGLSRCQFIFQLIQLSDDEDEEITFFERIGRGGIQITQRQLAVSKLMILLGKEGNDAIASFQRSEKLLHLLDTEDVIHGVSRIAIYNANNDDNNVTDKQHEELLELSSTRLKKIQKNRIIWEKFVEFLKKYCKINDKGRSLLQIAFEALYDSLRFDKHENRNGFSLVQLAQSDNKHGRIIPLTLHPLLFCFLVNSDRPLNHEQREDMLRWLLFVNGFIDKPMHERFNKEVFRLVTDNKKFIFSKINEFIASEEQIRKELGFSFDQPEIDKDGTIIQKKCSFNEIPDPEFVSNLGFRRLVLQDWPSSQLNNFLLMWNQREALEHFYGEIDYRPALYSKGRPFDADHVVARSRFLYNYGEGINNKAVKDGIDLIIKEFREIPSIGSKGGRLTANCLRKYFPNMIANYRYWPKRLNRYDQNKSVEEKFEIGHVKKGVEGHPLNDKFDDENLLWKWSSIPPEDREMWKLLPPKDNKWDSELIGKFILAILKRDRFLYREAYDFINNR